MDSELRNVASSSRAIRKKRSWTQMIPVPANLLESYRGVLSSKVTLRSSEHGKKWRVKVEKFKNQYYFTDGWKEFEEEVNLKSRELRMHRTASSIRRSLLGKNKEKRRKISRNAHGAISSLDENNGSSVEEKLGFITKLKEHQKYKLVIPNNFAKSTGILERDEIKLKNSEGREWRVHVAKSKDRVSLCGGWVYFLKDNNMVVGSTLAFISSSSDNIDVHIIKEGTDKKALLERFRIPFTGFGVEGFEETLSFHKVIKKHHQYQMVIPSTFVMTNGKLESGQINLKNSEGREWPVTVTDHGPYSLALGAGWFNFLKGNNVIVGSTLSFYSISSCTIAVRIVKEGTDKQALFKCLKKNVKVVEGRSGDLNNASDHENVPGTSLSAAEEEMDLDSDESD